jgi:hypothetical protein
MKENNSILEILWIVGVFIISIGLTFALTGKPIYKDQNWDIQHYNTYLSLDLKLILFSIFIVLLLLVYIIKEGLLKFTNPFRNIILALIIIGNIISLTFLIKILSLVETVDMKTGESNKLIPLIILALFILQVVLLGGLFLLGIRIGILTKKRPAPTPGWRG